MTIEGSKELRPLRKQLVVYKLTNIINNKIYIGITSKLRQRLRQHSRGTSKGSKQYIHKAISKYGINAFSVKVLAVCKNDDELNDMEVIFIKSYSSDQLGKGYNLTSGGKRNIPNAETILKRRASSKKCPVGQYSLDGYLIEVYESIMEASRTLDIPDTDIHRCCKKAWSRKGYMFSKSCLPSIEPYVSNRGDNLIHMEPHNKIKCSLLNKKTLEVFKGNSLKEVAKKAGIDRTTIHRIKNKETRTWKLLQD